MRRAGTNRALACPLWDLCHPKWHGRSTLSMEFKMCYSNNKKASSMALLWVLASASLSRAGAGSAQWENPKALQRSPEEIKEVSAHEPQKESRENEMWEASLCSEPVWSTTLETPSKARHNKVLGLVTRIPFLLFWSYSLFFHTFYFHRTIFCHQVPHLSATCLGICHLNLHLPGPCLHQPDSWSCRWPLFPPFLYKTIFR